MSLAILKRLTAMVLSWPLASTTRVFRALRFEMICRFAERDAGPLLEMTHHFARKIVVPIQPGADRGAAEREFLERGDRLLGAPNPEPHLLRVAAKFLAEPDRRRVHQMGAPDLDHVVKFLRLRGQRARADFPARG